MRVAAAALAATLLSTAASAQSTGGFGGPGSGIDPKWAYIFAGSAYVASTNTMSVPAGDYATALFCNTNATRKMMIYRRRMDNNVSTSLTGAASFQWAGLSGAKTTAFTDTAASTSVSGPTPVATLADVDNTYPAATDATFQWGVGTTSVAGTITGTGQLSVTADPYELSEPRIIGPGTCIAMWFLNKSATASFNVGLTLYWARM